MSDLYFGSPENSLGVLHYFSELDRYPPVECHTHVLEARGLDPFTEVEKMNLAVTALQAAADKFQEDLKQNVDMYAHFGNHYEIDEQLKEKMTPLEESRLAILQKLTRLAEDYSISNDPALFAWVARLRSHMTIACAGISLWAWDRARAKVPNSSRAFHGLQRAES